MINTPELYYLEKGDIEFINNLNISVEDKKKLISIYAHALSKFTSSSITSIMGNIHALSHMSGDDLIDTDLAAEDIYRELDSAIIDKIV